MSKDEKGTCPVGGDWYTCTSQAPTFFGCCTSNPCRGDNTGCPIADLRAAGLGTSLNPDNTKNGTYFPNTKCSKGQWWTCDVPQKPSFQGCCDANPCNGVGCPAGSLQQAAFITIPPELSPTAAVTPSSSTTTPTQTGAGSAGNTSGTEKTSSSSNIGAIAGGAAGGAVVLIIAILLLWMCRRRRQRKSAVSTNFGGVDGSTNTSADKSAHQQASETKKPRYSLLGIPIPSKYAPVSMTSPPVSPGPPPYQTPLQSPNPNVHEIDSTHVHEISDTTTVQSSAAVRALNPRALSQELDSSAVQSRYQSPNSSVESPILPGLSSWGAQRLTGAESVEIGDGTPRIGSTTPVSGMLSPVGDRQEGRDSYGSTANGSHPLLLTIGMMKVQPSSDVDPRREGRNSYVGWQNMSP